LVVICLMAFIVLFVPALPNTPFFIDVGDFEVTRTLMSIFPIILGMRWWGEYKNLKLGLEGEGLVTKILKSVLPDQYYLINDVTSSDCYGNIDHVILSPNGIFVIETKNYKGKISCQRDLWSRKSGGKIGGPSIQAKSNASKIYKIIKSLEKFKSSSLWVVPNVVFSNLEAELTINEKTLAIKNLYILSNYIVNYEVEKQFSPQDLDLIGNEILRQTS